MHTHLKDEFYSPHLLPNEKEELTGKEKHLEALYYRGNPEANMRLSQAYDRGMRAAARHFMKVGTWLLAIVALLTLAALRSHAQQAVPPFTTTQMNSTLYVGQGAFTTIQAAVTQACSKMQGARVVIPAGTTPADAPAAVTGCATVFVDDQRTSPSTGYAWTGTAYRSTAALARGLTYGTSYFALGDSITCGYVNAGHGGPYTPGEDCHTANAYPSIISSLTNVPVLNYAIPADQACDLWPRQIAPYGISPSVAAGNALATMMIGTNDANAKGTGAYEALFNLCQRAALTWLTVPVEAKTLPSGATLGAGWTLGSQSSTGPFAISSTAGSTITFPLTTYGGPIYLWHTINDTAAPSPNSGTFTYSVDGAAPVSVTTQAVPAMATQNGTTNSVAVQRIPKIAAGNHGIAITLSSGTVAILGVGTPPANSYFLHPAVVVGDVPYLPGVAPANVTQYTADVAATIALLQSDGLDVRLASNHSYMLGSAAEMQSDGIHPTPLGALHYAQAFAQILQAVPIQAAASPSFAAKIIAANYTVLPTDQDIYAGCSAACTATFPQMPTGQHVTIMASGSAITIAAGANVTFNGITSGYSLTKGKSITLASYNSQAWTVVSQF